MCSANPPLDTFIDYRRPMITANFYFVFGIDARVCECVGANRSIVTNLLFSDMRKHRCDAYLHTTFTSPLETYEWMNEKKKQTNYVRLAANVRGSSDKCKTKYNHQDANSIIDTQCVRARISFLFLFLCPCPVGHADFVFFAAACELDAPEIILS